MEGIIKGQGCSDENITRVKVHSRKRYQDQVCSGENITMVMVVQMAFLPRFLRLETLQLYCLLNKRYLHCHGNAVSIAEYFVQVFCPQNVPERSLSQKP